jgi:hypothetical protein
VVQLATIGQALASPETGWQRLDASTQYLSYVGSWSLNSTYDMISTSNPSSFTFKFYGTQFRLLSYNSSNRRSMNITIDGVLTSSNISNSIGSNPNTLAYEKTGLTLGTHTIKVEYNNDNTYSTIDSIDIDSTGYFVGNVGSALTSPEPTWKRIDDTDSNFVYDSNWTTGTNASDYNGTYHNLASKTGKIDFYFYGTKIRLIFVTNSTYSDQMKVTIDGVSQIFSLVNTSQLFMTLAYEKTGLSKSTHKVTIENLVPKLVYFDAIDIDDTGYMTNSYLTKALIQATNGNVLSYVPKNNGNLIPTMTSTTAPSGVASASSIAGTSNDSWYAFDKTVNGTSNAWLSVNPSSTGWLQYKFPFAKVVRSYAVTGTSTTSISPKNWTFEGSNDGLNYDILDTQSNISFTTLERKIFNINNIKPYLYYRINISAGNGGAYLGVAELEMYDISSKVVYVSSDEFSFINNGITQNTFLDLNDLPTKKSQIDKSPVTLGSGKVFKTTINTANIPIKLINIK